MQTASEDFSDIPTALGAPYTYWGIGRIDPVAYQNAADPGQIDEGIPANHSPGLRDTSAARTHAGRARP